MQDKADLVISYSDGGGTMVHVTVTFSITSTAENVLVQQELDILLNRLSH